MIVGGVLVPGSASFASGTPWLSSFAPQDILAMARHPGIMDASHVSAAMLNERYFAIRTDDLRTSPRRGIAGSRHPTLAFADREYGPRLYRPTPRSQVRA